MMILLLNFNNFLLNPILYIYKAVLELRDPNYSTH